MACRYHYRGCYINCTVSGNSCNFFRKHLTRFTEKVALFKRNTHLLDIKYSFKGIRLIGFSKRHWLFYAYQEKICIRRLQSA